MSKKNTNKKTEKETENSINIRELTGKRISQLRKEKCLSQTEFAEDFNKFAGTNISLSSIHTWEQGLREPRPDVRQALCDYFNVDMNYLTGISPVKNAFQSKGKLVKIYNISDNKIDDEAYVMETMILPEAILDEDNALALIIDQDIDTKELNILKDDVVIFKKTGSLFNNTVQLIDLDGKLAIRRVEINGPTVSLISDGHTLEKDRCKVSPLGKYIMTIRK